MRTTFLAPFAMVLALAATAPALAQTKVKTKASRRVTEAQSATTTATATPDWSLPYAATITPDGLKADLSVLASDEYEGRETGKKGQKMAADYLAKAFAADGLTGPVAGSDNPHLQHFDMNRSSLDAPATTVKVGGQTYYGNKDFYALLGSKFEAPASVQPVFLGYGIKNDKYSDFATPADYKDKDVIVLMGEPLNAAGQSLLGAGGKASPFATADMKGLVARRAGLLALPARSITLIMPSAAAFAQVPKGFERYVGSEELTFAGDTPKGQALNLLMVSPELGAKLLGTTPAGLDKYRQAVGKAGKAIPSPFKPVPTTVQAVMKKETFTTENVLGYLEGSDKKDEVLVLSAHYDHLGVKDGKVYNGADDDGSGTVSVLALARAFAQAKKDGHGPHRSILFLANVGEEEGLLGSRYYTDHPIFPLKNTVTDLNIDMVGRVDSVHQGKGDYVYVAGDDKLSDELHTLSEATNQQYNPVALDYKYNDPKDPQGFYYRSDHYNFAKHKVPVIFYTSGLHPQYHQATDDVALIDFPAMARRDQLVFHTAWALANRDTRVALKPEFLKADFTPASADLDRYVGTYVSPATPLKTTLSREGSVLNFQVPNQPMHPLEAVSKDVFKFDPTGTRIEFDAAQPTFKLNQRGREFEFKKE